MAITQRTTNNTDPKLVSALRQGLESSGLGDSINLNELNSTQLLALYEAVQALRNNGGNNKHNDVNAAGEVNTQKAEEATKSLNQISEEVIAVDIFNFLALFAKLAQEQRETGRLQRNAAMTAEINAKHSAITAMKDASDKRFLASCVQGGLQIGGGAVQLGLQGIAMRDTVNGARQDLQGKALLADADELKKTGMLDPTNMDPVKETSLTKQGNALIADGARLSARGTMLSGAGQAVSSLFGGVGTIASGGLTQAADTFEQEKAKRELEAKTEETKGSQAQEWMQQMMEIVRDSREKTQSIQQAASQANSGVAKNIA